MRSLYRIASNLPLPESTILEWERRIIQRSHAKEVVAARNCPNREAVDKAVYNYHFEIQMHQEDEDAYLTRKLLSEARKLRFSIPHRTEPDGDESYH